MTALQSSGRFVTLRHHGKLKRPADEKKKYNLKDVSFFPYGDLLDVHDFPVGKEAFLKSYIKYTLDGQRFARKDTVNMTCLVFSSQSEKDYSFPLPTPVAPYTIEHIARAGNGYRWRTRSS